MTDKTLVERVAREIQASQKTSETPAGQSKPSAPAEAMAATINQVFALFRLNYHTQYYAASPDDSQLKQVKKLWLDALSDFDPELILRGAKSALENSEYLPTLNRMLDACRAQAADAGLPPAHAAFVEACSARTPRSAQAWSHPAVYLAGRDTDWFFLSNNPESVTWPVFRDHYAGYVGRALRGEQFEVPRPAAIPAEATAERMSKEAKLSALKQLREDAGL